MDGAGSGLAVPLVILLFGTLAGCGSDKEKGQYHDRDKPKAPAPEK